MPPPVAAGVCLAFVAYLFWREFRIHPEDRISWAPFVWMFLAGSRYVSTWLSFSGPSMSAGGYAEGSPVDRAAFFSLIAWGLVVLAGRNIEWATVFRRNWLLAVYLSFCLSSVLWTDEPVILVKRWIKDLGNPIMALVLLTETRPYAAIGATLRRLSYVCIPVSVLFVRYYPEMGRAYKASGAPMYTGIGQQKNSLGLVCLIAGIYFAWRWLCRGPDEPRWRPGYQELVLMLMIVWLLNMSDSQTSTVCLVISLAIMLLSRVPMIVKHPSRLLPTVACLGVAVVALEAVFQIKDSLLLLMGRDASLTNRDELWDVVLAQQVSPLVGAGFMSFWAGDRMTAIWRQVGAGVNQAHNGYLEQYLNLGYIGVLFIVALVWAALAKVRRGLQAHPSEAILRFVLIVCAAFYNYTEAAFYGISNIWVLFLVAYIDVPYQTPTDQPADTPTRGARRRAATDMKAAHRRMKALTGARAANRFMSQHSCPR